MKYRIKHIKHDYFSKANINKFPERLIIVGFIAADGCVHHKNIGQNLLIFNISKKDKTSLNMINSEISNGTRKLFEQRQTNSLNLNFPSNQICDDLIRFNIRPRKTANYDLPDLNAYQMKYFLRGYFYGDGCIDEIKPGCYLIGSEKFACSLKKFLESNEIVERCNIYDIKNSKYKQIRMYGRMAAAFSKYIFSNDKLVLLPRKHKIIEDVKFNRKWTQKEKNLIQSGIHIDKFCETAGRNKQNVIDYIRKRKFIVNGYPKRKSFKNIIS